MELTMNFWLIIMFALIVIVAMLGIAGQLPGIVEGGGSSINDVIQIIGFG